MSEGKACQACLGSGETIDMTRTPPLQRCADCGGSGRIGANGEAAPPAAADVPALGEDELLAARVVEGEIQIRVPTKLTKVRAVELVVLVAHALGAVPGVGEGPRPLLELALAAAELEINAPTDPLERERWAFARLRDLLRPVAGLLELAAEARTAQGEAANAHNEGAGLLVLATLARGHVNPAIALALGGA